MLVDIYIFYKRNEMFYLIMHSKQFIYGYMSDIIMVKDHSDSERGNPLLQLSISSKGNWPYSDTI